MFISLSARSHPFPCRNINVLDCRALPPAPLGVLNNTEHATAYPSRLQHAQCQSAGGPEGLNEGPWAPRAETHSFSRSSWWPPRFGEKKKLARLEIRLFHSSDAALSVSSPEMGVREAGRGAHRPPKGFRFQTSVSACLLLSSVPLAETQRMTL